MSAIPPLRQGVGDIKPSSKDEQQQVMKPSIGQDDVAVNVSSDSALKSAKKPSVSDRSRDLEKFGIPNRITFKLYHTVFEMDKVPALLHSTSDIVRICPISGRPEISPDFRGSHLK